MMRRKVYICYDSDVTDNPRVQKAEQRLSSALSARGLEARAVRLPSAPDGGKQGADDFLKAKGKVAFARLVREAKSTDSSNTKGGEPVLQKFADLKAQNVAWLWRNRIACGMLNAIIGNPGEGKSTLAMEIAARGSRGKQPYSGSKCERFTTLYLSNENVHAITSKPRFSAMGGDESRMFALDKIRAADGTERGVTLDDIDVIEKAIKQTHAQLVIIDPLQSYLGAAVDSHKANETRAKLDPLAALAERTGAAILIVAHTAKASSGRSIHAMLGSIDIAGAMRSILMVGGPPNQQEDRVLMVVKNSVGPWDETLAFRIEKAEGTGAATRIEWRGVSNLTYADICAPERQKTESQINRAQKYLRSALADGPRLATELYAEWAEENGQTLNNAERMLQKAQGPMRIIHTRNGEGFQSTRLPGLYFCPAPA